MKVLVACEESQEVCKAFRALRHEAYSADIQEPSGGHPEWHILGDVIPIINGFCEFRTMDGVFHRIDDEVVRVDLQLQMIDLGRALLERASRLGHERQKE